MENFFNGKLVAHGFFKDRFNYVSKTFVVTMNATWVKDTCTLEEDFVYSDGTKSRRVWTIVRKSSDEYIGTAPDVIGEAHGKVVGNALYWKYTLRLPVDGKEYDVTFKDWMYLIDNETLLNQSYMSKLGIDLGEVVLSIRKVK
jgi:hypothetical protein